MEAGKQEREKGTMIEVKSLGNGLFQVRVIDGNEETRHSVSLEEADYQRLSEGRVAPEELVRRSFEFLLEREPKEAILKTFFLRVIGDYFPEFENEIRRRT